jgi:hypothetical protein
MVDLSPRCTAPLPSMYSGNWPIAIDDFRKPLLKNKTGCREHSDCGFGCRVVPRLSVEIGSYFLKNRGVAVLSDHMSGKELASDQYEGIDHGGDPLSLQDLIILNLENKAVSLCHGCE